jgi:hypothetical protein
VVNEQNATAANIYATVEPVVCDIVIFTVTVTVTVTIVSYSLAHYSLIFSLSLNYSLSYQYMESVVSCWDQMRILQRCMAHKLIYLETKDVVETTLALDNYKRACDCGRDAVFFSIARGKVG